MIGQDELVTTAHWPAGDVLVAELKEAGFEPGQAPDGMQVWRMPK
ncbi:hypothetical protein ACFQ0B_71180 [Nonomuraea thailandensis]